MSSLHDIERHPLEPFLPYNARVIMLGSFPPPKTRWCMNFFYPNPQNDMWRIMGLLFYGDKQHFVSQDRTFLYSDIVEFCSNTGIAIFDTATAVRRLRDNAADEFLEIIEPTDIGTLLNAIPFCQDICCTGQKSLDTISSVYGCGKTAIGKYTETTISERHIRIWRMPSSSRAYPLSIEKKAEAYATLFRHAGLMR